ncbi:MAG: GntR family transcriptional regulator [Burkholderiales bacterium]|nr:MAG: GntR family transcriptional regulator [Burkholderiales bacterium]
MPKAIDAATETDALHQRLREDIVTCRLAPGTRVSEAVLAEGYACGKAPVRAALARLRQEGWVRAEARKATVIAPITLQDVHELYELRLLLEPAAARLAAGRIERRELSRLRALAKQRYLPGNARSTLEFLAANREFHLLVATATKNSLLARALADLLDRMTRVMHLGLGLRDRTRELRHDHQALLAALTRGDGSAAETLARKEIEDSRRMVLEALTKADSLRALPLQLGG